MTPLRIKPNGSRVSLQAALAYNPCDGCNRIVGNAEIVSHFCGTCEYGDKKEVVDSSVLKAKQGDSPSPEKGDGGLKPNGPDGQLALSI